jgi:DNA-directed RNA polymerase specialized sigma24 family protein
LDDLIAKDDPALASVPSEDHSDIGAAISSLHTDYRKPLVLQALMGYSTEEIAQQMGLTRSTVLCRLHRARLKLRLALGTSVADGTSALRPANPVAIKRARARSWYRAIEFVFSAD